MAQKKSGEITKRIPPQLGIRFDDKVWQYSMTLMSLAMVAPDQMMRRLHVLPEIIEYVFPDPKFTQARLRELLNRVEIFSRASQIILDRAGPDFFERAIRAIVEPLRLHLPAGRAPTQTEMEQINAEIGGRLEAIFDSYSTKGDPGFRAATKVLLGFNDIFDLEGRAAGPQTLRALGISAIPKGPRSRKGRRG